MNQRYQCTCKVVTPCYPLFRENSRESDMKPRFRSLVPVGSKSMQPCSFMHRPDDLSNKLESWGDCWVNFFWRNLVRNVFSCSAPPVVLLGPTPETEFDTFWDLVLKTFEIIINHLGSLTLLKGQLWWGQLGTQVASRCRRWVSEWR